MTRARLIIAEDYEPTQAILRQLLERHYDVVAAVSNGRALLEAVEAYKPHGVVLDISMPVMNGIAAAKRLRPAHPEMKIIFVSAHSEQAYIDEAFKAGANTYILKNSIERELVKALESLLPGGVEPL